MVRRLAGGVTLTEYHGVLHASTAVDLDSTFLVDVLRGTDDVTELVADLDAPGTAFVTR